MGSTISGRAVLLLRQTNAMKHAFITTILALLLTSLALRPVTTYDTYFGIKIGERITQTKQISNIEAFSWSAEGRAGNAYEWLSHLWVYTLTRMGGIGALAWYVAIMFGLSFALQVYLWKKIFQKDSMLTTGIVFLTSALTYEFFVARPQVVSFLFLPLFIAVSLQPNVLMLILLLPLTYLWTNMHASFILIPYCLFISALLRYIQKDKRYKMLAVFGLLSIFITLLPPIAPQPYQLLLDFGRDRHFLADFISEWAPVGTISYLTITYAFVTICVLLSLYGLLKQPKTYNKTIRLLPFLPLILFGWTAVRSVPYGIITSSMIIIAALPKKIYWNRWVTLTMISIVGIFSLWFIQEKRNETFAQATTMPINAVEFLKTNHVSGRMFNHMAIGGYLIYMLHPDYRVFFDGRAEVYKNDEMRAFFPILKNKAAPRNIFAQTVRTFLDHYQFSFVILPIGFHDPLRATAHERMADVLLDQTDWVLIYLDDTAMIFVKQDGKNNRIIDQFGLFAVLPYRLIPFLSDKRSDALEEYKRIMRQTPSAVAQHGLNSLLRTSH